MMLPKLRRDSLGEVAIITHQRRVFETIGLLKIVGHILVEIQVTPILLILVCKVKKYTIDARYFNMTNSKAGGNN